MLSIQESIIQHVEYTLARSRFNFDNFEAYQAASFSVRDRLIEHWNDTQTYFKEQDPKRCVHCNARCCPRLLRLPHAPHYSAARRP